MLELTLNAEMAVKLIKLKKQAQIELGEIFSIANEDSVAYLLSSAATFHHKHSKARVLALELLDGVEALDDKARHVAFIARCRGDLAVQKVQSEVAPKIYRGQSVLLEEEANNTRAEKVVYYRGQKIISSE